MKSIILRGLAVLALLSVGTGNAFAQASIDRIRCTVKEDLDLVKNVFPRVLIQVKVGGPDVVDIWVVNATHPISGLSATSPTVSVEPALGGGTTAAWNTFPEVDPLTGLQVNPEIMLIDGNFVVDGGTITVHARYVATGLEVQTVSAPCGNKVKAQFKQDTKPSNVEKAAAKAEKLAAKLAARNLPPIAAAQAAAAQVAQAEIDAAQAVLADAAQAEADAAQAIIDAAAQAQADAADAAQALIEDAAQAKADAALAVVEAAARAQADAAQAVIDAAARAEADAAKAAIKAADNAAKKAAKPCSLRNFNRGKCARLAVELP